MADVIITTDVKRIIDEAEMLGITDYYKVRNLKMLDEYLRLRKSGMGYAQAIDKVTENQNPVIEFKTVETIILKAQSKMNNGSR